MRATSSCLRLTALLGALVVLTPACSGGGGADPGGEDGGNDAVFPTDGGGGDAPSDAAGPDAGDGGEDAADPCEGVTCEDPPNACYAEQGTCEDGECVYEQVDGEPCDDGDPCTENDSCQGGSCEGEPVTCDTPPEPTACYQPTGSCEGEEGCTYDFDNGAVCDDGDACTVNDTCSGGECSGEPKSCEEPPADECLDDTTLLSYADEGDCDGGECSYPSIEVDCPSGCSDGACIGDPCQGVTCDDPPGPCYEAQGTCSGGECSYDPDDGASCDDGDPCTVDDTCQGGSCEGSQMSCTSPPDDECVDANTLRSYTTPGVCDGGSCTYGSTEIDCPNGCSDGACEGDPCEGVTCDTPPSPTACYEAEGTCSGGSCDYDYADGSSCDDGDPCTIDDSCENGTCSGTPKPCDDPPESTCDGSTLTTYAQSGTCDGGTCSYDESTTECDFGCSQGACDGDPCQGVTCDDPPADACVDSTTLRTYEASGTCSGGQCDYPSSDQPCPFGCEDAACNQPTGIVISEVFYDEEGGDGPNVFVELHAEAGQSMDGLVLVGVNGYDGEDLTPIELEGTTDSDGLYVVATTEADEELAGIAHLQDDAANLQNGPDSVELRFQGEVIDAVAYGDFDADEVPAGEGDPAPDPSSGKSIARDEQYTDTDDNASDFSVLDTPTPGDPNVVPNQAPEASLDCPSGGTVGQAATFDASGSGDPDGSIEDYAFDFGDGTGTSGTEAQADHTYDSTGDYTVTVTVTDDEGATAEASCDISVNEDNEAPTAQIGCPSGGTVGSSVSFDASGSTDPDGSIDSYAFDFGDGESTSGASASASHTYGSAGDYTVTVTVTDDDGATDQASCTASISDNDAPDAQLACPSGGQTGEDLEFDAGGSSDPDGSIDSYAFDFGDGNNVSGTQAVVSHSYASTGTYDVTLTVTDDEGATAQASCSVTISSADAPEVDWVKPSVDVERTQGEAIDVVVDVTPASGRSIEQAQLLVDGQTVGSPDDTAPYSFDWNVPQDAATGSTIELQVQATDDEGGTGTSTTRSVHVVNDEPVASFSAVITGEQEVSVDASGVSDTETAAEDLEVRWDWTNDGSWDTSWTTTKTASHGYDSSGSFTIAMQVRDAVGQTASASQSIDFQEQIDASGEVTSTTWYGSVNVTGDVHVPSGETLTISEGTTVAFVELDQDDDGDGDYGLTVDGTLKVEGSESDPVTFTALDTNDESDAKAWDRVLLALNSSGHVIQHAVFEFAVTGLEVNANDATIEDTEFRQNETGLRIDDGEVTLTDVSAHDNLDVGVRVGDGAVTSSGLSSTDNGGRGVYVDDGSNASAHAFSGCTVSHNGEDGFDLEFSVAIEECVVEKNGETGLFYRGLGGGSLKRSQVRDNAYAGVRALSHADSNPEPTLRRNNIQGNAGEGNLHLSPLDPTLSVDTAEGSYEDEDSDLWTVPSGGRVVGVELDYNSPDLDSDYSYDVTTEILDEDGDSIESFFGFQDRSWHDFSDHGASGIRVHVDDDTVHEEGSIEAHRVAWLGAGTQKQVVVVTSSGTVDARRNYFGTWPDVLKHVRLDRHASLDLQGFVGEAFGESFGVGPYRGGKTLEEDTTWSGQVYLTGDVDVASGATLTLAPGTTVSAVPIDQDDSGTGDYVLDRGAGSLVAEGLSGERITFDVLGEAPAEGGWAGIDGDGNGSTSLARADLKGAYRGVQAEGGSVTIEQSTITGAVDAAVRVDDDASLTMTDSTVTESSLHGISVHSGGGAASLDDLVVENNAGWGLRMDGADDGDNVVKNSEFLNNGAGGVELRGAQVDFHHNNVKQNGYGVWLVGSTTGSVGSSNILFNDREGVLVTATGTDAPSASVNGCNIFENGASRRLTSESFDLSVSTAEGSYEDEESELWSTPDPGGDASAPPIEFLEVQYNAPDFDSDYTYDVTVEVLDGDGDEVASFYGFESTHWVDVSSQGPSSVRAAVDDDTVHEDGSITIGGAVYGIAAADGEPTIELTAVLDGGTFDAGDNYWGEFPDVEQHVQEIVDETVDFSGFKSSEISGAGPQ